MKFTLVKDLRSDILMRPLLLGLLLFLLLFLVADMLNAAHLLGLDALSVTTTLAGSEEEYIEPLPQASLLEYLHTETFFLMMTLGTLGAIYGRLGTNTLAKIALINAAFIFAVSTLLCLLGAYYLDPACVLPYLVSFWLWHAAAVLMALHALWRLARA